MNVSGLLVVKNSDGLTSQKREQLISLLRAYFIDQVTDANGVFMVSIPEVAQPANMANHVSRVIEMVHEEVSPSLVFVLEFSFSASQK